MGTQDPQSEISIAKIAMEMHSKTHIGQIESLMQKLAWTIEDPSLFKDVSDRLAKIKVLVIEEVRLRKEAESDVHKAIIACGQLCDAIEPTRNKYKKK